MDRTIEHIRFADRTDAGRRLAEQVHRSSVEDPLVLALPRGGVPVAAPIAERLGAPLEVIVARKVGAPGASEYGIGAVAEGGFAVRDAAALEALDITEDVFEARADRQRDEIDRRVERYRRGRPLPDVRRHDVVLVDDGLATGVTARAAIGELRSRGCRRLILAVPVCAPDTATELRRLVDELICLSAPPGFGAVGAWYDNFEQTSDDVVLEILDAAVQGRRRT